MKLKRPAQLYDLVEVWWDDASALKHGWEEKDADLKPQMVLSVGFLIKETDDHILIAQDIDPQGMHNGRTQIPRGMVKNIKVLKREDGAKKVVVPQQI